MNDFGFTWEGIGAVIAIVSSLFGLYSLGNARGKLEAKILQHEKDIASLRQHVDTSLKEVTDRLTRMEERLYNQLLRATQSIRGDIKKFRSNSPNDFENDDNENAA